MKRIYNALSFGILFCFLAICSANAWFVQGKVFCDSDLNGQIDAQDAGLPSVLVIATNLSGTYSNASWTAADGFFIVPLIEAPDSYAVFIHPATIPADSMFIIPPTGVWFFNTTSNNTTVSVNFLISSSNCPPVVAMRTNACWLTGGGTISPGKGKPTQSFGGVVFPGCNPTAGNGGNWNVVAHKEKLHLKGSVIDMVNCGNVPGIPPGSRSPVTPFNFIEFQGTGTLEGISGNKQKFGDVFFFVRAEDRGEPGKGTDRYYLRVFDAAGATLLLVSGDPANPLNVVPIPITTGNLQLHSSSCGP